MSESVKEQDQPTAAEVKNEMLKSKYDAIKEWAVAFGVLITLISSILSSVTSHQNSKQLQSLEERFYNELDTIAANFVVDELIPPSKQFSNYKLEGRFETSLSQLKDHDLWVFVNDGDSFYAPKTPIVVSSDQRWFHNSVPIAIDGRITLVFAVVDKSESKRLQSLANSTPSLVMNGLSDSFKVIDHQHINKEGDKVTYKSEEDFISLNQDAKTKKGSIH
ncbi:hypothetical protein [Sediminitomix flava]|uniref:Uncharacterized protein n=1 Tax=Sediminitomix flava TaxID=379075 RepID=A0A315ZHP9_SEDFL|nr:hypothetical protein [Sediminitomix flava]PWJ44234.1 hypothetical protein BC781_101584 [Sediminitomix flava]